MGIWKLFESNFERFRRIEGDATHDLSGLGLGLSITKAYVEMLGERSK
jgi:signal transduction histidine kinase